MHIGSYKETIPTFLLMCIIVASTWSGCCIMISILFRCWTARVGKKCIIACACYFTFTLNWQSQVIALCWVIQRGLMAADWESVGQLRKRWGKSAQPSCDLHHAPALSKPLRIRWANQIIKLAAVLKRINGLKCDEVERLGCPEPQCLYVRCEAKTKRARVSGRRL